MSILQTIKQKREEIRLKKLKNALDQAKTHDEAVEIFKKQLEKEGLRGMEISLKKALHILKGSENIELISKKDYELLRDAGVSANEMRKKGVKIGELYKDSSDKEMASLVNNGNIDVRDLTPNLSQKHQEMIIKQSMKTKQDKGARIILKDEHYTEIALANGLDVNGIVSDEWISAGEFGTMSSNTIATWKMPYLMLASDKVAEKLLQHGANPDVRYVVEEGEGEYVSPENLSLLEFFMKKNNSLRVSQLLKYGANPFLVDKELNPDNSIDKIVLQAREKGKDYYFNGKARYDAVKKYVISPVKDKLLPELEKSLRDNSVAPLHQKLDKMNESLGDKANQTGTQTGMNISHVRTANKQVNTLNPMIMDAIKNKKINSK